MVDTIYKKASLQYYRWELTTAIYMLEPWEKIIVNSLFIALLTLAIYACITYLPNSIVYTFERVAAYIHEA
ncbi:hypothetical protein BDF19DRAFT_451395 [Syncephalis fuscata]|nr:hypothetical protein BDF19DRAFT_451395 [Syncephalis fuscata]